MASFIYYVFPFFVVLLAFEAIATRVRSLLEDRGALDGTAEPVAVVFPRLEDYLPLVREVFPRHGIPFETSMGPALAECAAVRSIDLALDERLQHLTAFTYPLLVGGTASIQRNDVVPGAHRHSTIDGNGSNGSMRKHEAQRQGIRQPQLRHDWLEIVTISPEAV